MASQNHQHDIDATYRLLALCARANGNSALHDQLAILTKKFTQWEALPQMAELHGMGGMFLQHSREAGVQIPKETLRTLNGMYARSHTQNRIYTRALQQTLSTLDLVNIHPLVLKGLALSFQYYPDVTLRPTTDIDLLIKKEDVSVVLNALTNAGYNTRLKHLDRKLIPREWTVYSPLIEGIRVQIELHYHDPRGRSDNDFSPDLEFYNADINPVFVKMNESGFYTTNPYRTLLYLAEHLRRHLFDATIQRPLKLKWIADIISLVEHDHKELDWDLIRRIHPAVIHQLEVFYSLTPLPEYLKSIINPARRISGVNQYPQGWPQNQYQNVIGEGYLKFLWLTFSPPSEWWLRIYYGIGRAPFLLYGQVIYRLQIIRRILWRGIQFLQKKFKPR